MQREVTLPVLLAGALGLALLLGVLWWAFLRPPSGADARLENKARELRERARTVPPPGP